MTANDYCTLYRWRIYSLLASVFLFVPITCLAHNPLVHSRITEAAAGSAASSSSGFNNFINVVSGSSPNSLSFSDGATNLPPVEWMKRGSQIEDSFYKDAGGFRQLNHFYDPFTKQGLLDWPINELAFGSTTPIGQDSYTWASFLNCAGIDISIVPLVPPIPIPANVGKSNTWSFQNARLYEWQGLTNADSLVRGSNLANMFRAIGQVAHLCDCPRPPINTVSGNPQLLKLI